MKIGYDAKRIFHNTTGLGNYCRDMIRILASYYPNNQYYLYNPKPAKVKRLTPDGVRVIERSPRNRFWKIFNSLWRQGHLIKDAEADNINIYHGLSGELPRGIAESSIASVVTIHDLIFVTHPHLYKALDRKIYLNKFQYAADNADLVVAISEYTKDQIHKYLKTDLQKIRVVYQTCHSLFKAPRPTSLVAPVRSKFDLPDRFIINVGTIEERKNLHSLIKAIAHTDHHVVVIGRKTNYFTAINKYVKKHKMSDRVHFLENVQLEELAAIYQMAELMVYTSLVEGFGIPIIESLYTSTPVICHHEGVFPEAAGPDSRYTDMTDPAAIRTAINEVWDDQQSKDHMITAGLEYVKRFDDQLIANNIMSIYNELT